MIELQSLTTQFKSAAMHLRRAAKQLDLANEELPDGEPGAPLRQAIDQIGEALGFLGIDTEETLTSHDET